MASVFSRWKKQLVKSRILAGLAKYPRYFADWRRYRRMEGAEPIRLKDTYPSLFDKTATTGVNYHYFYQDLWAFNMIYAQRPTDHVDVGSNVKYVGFLTAITQVQFVDIRPLSVANVNNLKSIKGSILEMPYEDNTVASLSCLHVAEHIGLGRYGDPLDPKGTQKAAAELSRCLAKGGNLYFALPVGRPRLCFNAHRIHRPQQILDYFSELKLVEFSGVDDGRNFVRNIAIESLDDAKYACGMFCFTK